MVTSARPRDNADLVLQVQLAQASRPPRIGDLIALRGRAGAGNQVEVTKHAGKHLPVGRSVPVRPRGRSSRPDLAAMWPVEAGQQARHGRLAAYHFAANHEDHLAASHGQVPPVANIEAFASFRRGSDLTFSPLQCKDAQIAGFSVRRTCWKTARYAGVRGQGFKLVPARPAAVDQVRQGC